jgi:uncharacterized oxidoreductase
MAGDELRIPADGMQRVLTRIYMAAGGSAEEAEAIARNLVEANLAGHDSHGVVRTERYVHWVEEGTLNFGRQVEVVTEAPGFLLLEGNHGFGQTVGPQAVRLGITAAKDHGFALVGLRRAGHLGRIGAFAEMACAEGLVSIHFVNVANSVLVTPFGGRERRMSTNPVCIGVPNRGPNGGGDFILDFATSKIAEGKVLVARKAGKRTPPGCLIDGAGAYTDDPGVMYGPAAPGKIDDPREGPGALAPMGEHKGSGLGLACELLAGALTGSGAAMPGSWQTYNGMLSIYLDPELMDKGHGWADSVAAYIDHVRACTPADPDVPVMIPGDPERKRRAERLANGLPLAPDAWDSILRAGESKGLDRAELLALAGV